jgi:membrane protease YdiL (CAAX protease family)
MNLLFFLVVLMAGATCLLAAPSLRRFWIYPFGVALALSALMGSANFNGLLLTLILGLIWAGYRESPNQTRFWALTLMSMLFKLSLVPGFSVYALTPRLYFGLSPLIPGLFALAYCRGALPQLQVAGFGEWSSFKLSQPARPTWPAIIQGSLIGILGIAGLAALGMGLGVISFQVKIPSFLGMHLLKQLFFVCPLEEAFYRGFFQRELSRYLEVSRWGRVAVTAGLFGLAHYFWAPGAGILIFCFIAGLLYGAVYEVSRSLTLSAACHFTLNAVHMICF